MDFKTKLSRLKMPNASVEADDVRARRAVPLQPIDRGGDIDPPDGVRPDERIDRLRALIGDAKQRADKRLERRGEAPRAPSWAALPGSEHQSEHGVFHFVERWLDVEHRHGHVPVRDALKVNAEIVGKLALDATLCDLDLSRLLIVDTETTGLSGGTGTIPFLIGLAWFDDGALKVEQLLAKNLGQEAAMLRFLAERVTASTCLVTYNGKSFDWPLLRTRYIMNRVPAPKVPPHLDLLHCTRRILKPRLGDVRLVDIETQLLGFHREDDVPGSAIPELYFRFLRGAPADSLSGVLEHNANDVIALAAVLGKLTQHFEDVHDKDDPRDHLAFAKVAARAEDESRALLFAQAAVDGGGDAEVVVGAFSLTAKLAKRRGDHGGAIEALRSALDAADAPDVVAGLHLALAKLYEHKVRRWDAALSHAQHTEAAEGAELHRKRVERLKRRLG